MSIKAFIPGIQVRKHTRVGEGVGWEYFRIVMNDEFDYVEEGAGNSPVNGLFGCGESNGPDGNGEGCGDTYSTGDGNGRGWGQLSKTLFEVKL